MFPISASHVCQLWRRASLANPDLWTTIWIGNRWQEEYVALFIQRSHFCPLSLKYSSNLPLESLPDGNTILLDIGCDCQWKEIHVHPSWDNLPKLLSKSSDTLETLVLTSTWDSKAYILDLAFATHLTHLSIIRVKTSIILYYDSFKLPCSGLTHLNLNASVTPHDILSILSECGNLEEFVLILAVPFTFN